MLDGGHNKFWGSFNTGFSHTRGGGANILHSLKGDGGSEANFTKYSEGGAHIFRPADIFVLVA